MEPRTMSKHERVSAALRADIEDGELQGPLPSEAELTARFMVSRSVVRQALATLEREGLISKRHGRGSFVTPISRVRRVVQSLNGLGMQLQGQGLDVTTHVLDYGIGTYPDAPAEWGGQTALHLLRLRSSRGQPIAVIDTHLPACLADAIPRADLEDASLHELLRSRVGINLARSQRSVLAVPAREHIAGLLGINAGAPILLLTGTTFDDLGRAVETFSTYHRGDRVAFDLETDLA